MGKVMIPGDNQMGVSLFLNNGLNFVLQKGSKDDNPGFENLRKHLHNPNTPVHATHSDEGFFELAAFVTQPDGSIKYDCFYIPCDNNLQFQDIYHITPDALTKPSQVFILDSGLNKFIENLHNPDHSKIKGLQAHLAQGGKRYITDIRENTLDLIAFGEGPDGNLQARAFQISFDNNLKMNTIEPIKSSALSEQSQKSASEIAERLAEEGPDLSSESSSKYSL